ncbi:DUF6158 family protein [Pseudonocardia sp.]|uniref:DUF6158 family protein n=1 Tax=Pseudonocardia sp. TaxID=60912 RepID=UPI00262C64E0|nr:DUF6158 family protein [Pseudonocardia sp.]
MTRETHGTAARELSDAELERQGTRAHATRNWVFLHGTADQFRHHTERMLELEQEYLRRHPKRTWQGAGGEAAQQVDRVEQLRQMLRTFGSQMEAVLAELAQAQSDPAPGAADVALLERFAAAPDGRMHKLEAHQAARELGLHAADVARLYTQDPPLLATAGAYRFLTDDGRARLRAPSEETAG